MVPCTFVAYLKYIISSLDTGQYVGMQSVNLLSTISNSQNETACHTCSCNGIISLFLPFLAANNTTTQPW